MLVAPQPQWKGPNFYKSENWLCERMRQKKKSTERNKKVWNIYAVWKPIWICADSICKKKARIRFKSRFKNHFFMIYFCYIFAPFLLMFGHYHLSHLIYPPCKPLGSTFQSPSPIKPLDTAKYWSKVSIPKPIRPNYRFETFHCSRGFSWCFPNISV